MRGARSSGRGVSCKCGRGRLATGGGDDGWGLATTGGGTSWVSIRGCSADGELAAAVGTAMPSVSDDDADADDDDGEGGSPPQTQAPG